MYPGAGPRHEASPVLVVRSLPLMSKVQEVDPLDGPLQSCACQGVSIEVLLYYSRVFRKNSQATHLPWKNSQATHLPWFPLWKPLPSTRGRSRCLFCLSDQNILQPCPISIPLFPDAQLPPRPETVLRPPRTCTPRNCASWSEASSTVRATMASWPHGTWAPRKRGEPRPTAPPSSRVGWDASPESFCWGIVRGVF